MEILPILLLTMDYPLWKDPKLSTFFHYCFIVFKRGFVFYNIMKHILPKMKRMEQLSIFDQDNENFSFKKSHFPGLYCLKKSWKKGHFWTKTTENLWKNVNFSSFWTSCFYSLERRFFRSRISCNTLCCPILPKKKHGNLANFALNHGLSSLERSQIVYFFPLLFLQSLNEVLFSKIL